MPPSVVPALPADPILNMPLVPSPKITPDSSRYIKQVEGPDNVLEVIVGRLQIFNLSQPPRRVQIGDESVANYALLSTTELSLQGLRVGSTVLNLWFPDADPSGKGKMIGFLVRVLPDPDARDRLERAYKNLEREINKTFPDSRVHIALVGDKIIVSGQAKDIADANMIMRVVQANVLPETADAPNLGVPAAQDQATSVNRMIPVPHRQVVNMLRVIGEQQVLLQVQVVEVDRAAARSIGLNFGVFRSTGSFFVGGTTGNLASTRAGNFVPFTTGVANTGLTGLGGLPNLPVALDHGQIQMAIAALRNLSYARYLAEPNLVAINGQTATFQAGGLLPIPVVTGTAVTALQGVNFIPTGVQLSFTPFITERDRVRLTINAEISDRDLNVVPTLIDGAAIPSLITRNFQTTVELRQGQTLAVAGLIENKLDADSSRIPGLGAIPGLHWLAGYSRIGNREKELVILVTPRLVHPLECKDVPPLPGYDLLEPDDCEFYLCGRLESHTGMDYRSPIRTDCDRVKQFKRCRKMEQSMLLGPSGPSMDLPMDEVGPPEPQGGPSVPMPDLPLPPGPGPMPAPMPAPMPGPGPGLPPGPTGPGSLPILTPPAVPQALPAGPGTSMRTTPGATGGAARLGAPLTPPPVVMSNR